MPSCTACRARVIGTQRMLKLMTRFLDLYRLLSSAAHVGFVGSRLFRDSPDVQNINPRCDSRATGFALISSSRILVEATRAREKFEGIDEGRYETVMAMIGEAKSVD